MFQHNFPTPYEYRLLLTEVEEQAMDLIRPVPIATIDPMLVAAEVPRSTSPKNAYGSHLRKIFNYFRFAISSEPQRFRLYQGRRSRYLVIDRTTGAFLGLFAVCDTGTQEPVFDDAIGWHERTYKYEDSMGRARAMNARRKEVYHQILFLARCLPMEEFGQLLGGKLLATMALSKDFIRALELRYSYKFAVIYALTLHGASSQYNRIPGLDFRGVSDIDGRGLYIGNVRKKGERYLTGDTPNLGKLCGPGYADTVEHWRTRWFLPRCERQGVEIIQFNKDRYRLSKNLSAADLCGEAK